MQNSSEESEEQEDKGEHGGGKGDVVCEDRTTAETVSDTGIGKSVRGERLREGTVE